MSIRSMPEPFSDAYRFVCHIMVLFDVPNNYDLIFEVPGGSHTILISV